MSNRGGRPTSYRKEYAQQAFRLCLLGATDQELADFWGVRKQTVYDWRKRHPKLDEAILAGKLDADNKVAQSLYRRALGYSHKAVKIVADAKTGADHTVDYTERYPPDTTACIFWLKNRRPDLWRDKKEIDHSLKDDLSDAELVKRAREQGNRLVALERQRRGNGGERGNGGREP